MFPFWSFNNLWIGELILNCFEYNKFSRNDKKWFFLALLYYVCISSWEMFNLCEIFEDLKCNESQWMRMLTSFEWSERQWARSEKVEKDVNSRPFNLNRFRLFRLILTDFDTIEPNRTESNWIEHFTVNWMPTGKLNPNEMLQKHKTIDENE